MPMGNELKELLKEGDGGTVKPPNKGHIGYGPFVPSKEVFPFSEVLFKTYWKILKDKNKL